MLFKLSLFQALEYEANVLPRHGYVCLDWLRYYLRFVAFAYYLPAYVFMLFSIDYLLAQVGTLSVDFRPPASMPPALPSLDHCLCS